MKYVLLGRTGVRVSQICLGTAFRGQWDDAVCTRVIDRALDHGINFIDTSDVYGEDRVGQAERVIGKALLGKREQVVLTTKIFNPIGSGPNDRGLSRVHLLREIDHCLRRLETDHVDVLFLHEPDVDTPLEESLRAMESIIAHGKARYVGLSRYPAWQAMEALKIAERNHGSPPAVLQCRYNLLYREAEIETLPFVRATGVGLMLYSPLAIGLLSGGFRHGQKPVQGSPWDRGYRGFDILMNPRTDTLVAELIAIGERRGHSPGQVAIAWLLQHQEVTSVIIGPDVPEQVDDGVAAVGWRLDEDEYARLCDLSAPEWLRRP